MPAKLNNQLVKGIRKSTSDLRDTFTENTNLQYSICPFTIIFGAVNATEAGYKPPTSTPNNFTSFSKIFTGREACIAAWDNSFDLIEPVQFLADDVGKRDNKVGDVFFGDLVSDEIGISYTASNMNNAFIQEQAVKNVTINIPYQDKNFKFFNNLLANMYKLYIIPELNVVKDEKNKIQADRQWYYLETASKQYNPTTKQLSFISATFVSLNDKLARTGVAINQYIQLGAVGAPVPFPTIDSFKNVVLDLDYLNPRPVTHCQVTFYGSVGKIAIALWGRKIDKRDGKREYMNPTQLIFPFNYQASTYDPVSFKSLPETNYVYTVNAESTADTYQEWRDMAAPIYDDNTMKNFEGHILSNEQKTTSTNDVDEETGKYLPYWDNKFLKEKEIEDNKFNVLSNPYFVYYNNSKKGIRGKVDGYTPNLLGTKNLKNINVLQYFLYNSLNEIPLSIRETTKISLNTIPVFGSFFNIFVGGMNIGFKNVSNILIPSFSKINFLMSAELYRFYSKVFYSTKVEEKNIMPFDVFRNETPDAVPAMLGTSSHTTSFTFNLTSNIRMTSYNINDNSENETEYKESINLAQFNREKSDEIWLLPKEENFDISRTVFNSDIEHIGYYIDMIDILVNGKTDFKVTFYSMPNDYDGLVSDDYAIWNGTYQTISKATGNIRLIRNTFVLANNSFSFKNEYVFPKKVLPPPPNEIAQPIFIDLSRFQIEEDDVNSAITTAYSPETTLMPPSQDQPRFNKFFTFMEIEIKNYGFENLDDFLLNYQKLEINWEYDIWVSGLTDANRKTSSLPLIIDDIKNIPIYEDDIIWFYDEKNHGEYMPAAIDYSTDNYQLVLIIRGSSSQIDNGYIEILGKMKDIVKKIDSTNDVANENYKKNIFVKLFQGIFFNKKKNTINIYTFVMKVNKKRFKTSSPRHAYHKVKFNNLQIFPRKEV